MSVSARMRPQSLFQKYGGFAAVRRVVMDFYDRALDSDLVGHYFEHVDMARLVDHQTTFVSYLLGGPAEANEKRLARAHADLGVTHAEFDEVKALLGQTLADAGFEPEDIAACAAAIEARRTLIVMAGAAP